MNQIKFLFSFLFILILTACQNSSGHNTKKAKAGGYTYEYVPNDTNNTRIYTLENGLKVYLSRYENAPRIHVLTSVKAGGKNDPKNNTGLAHYLEHIMFKGNQYFGTIDYATEKPLLDSIENLFNRYASLTDQKARTELYKKIDVISNEAAKFAIPNEFDKMMSTLGAKGLNAGTSNDYTVYTVDIPSNEIERFLTLEGLRFKQIVNRLFHTELEAVYEEKNRALDSDPRKVRKTLYENLFKKHPYGSQTTIGTIEHLKNPSITEIVNYFNTYYRPNNVAICMSGELDYDKTIALIDKNFGDWKPNKTLPKWEKIIEEPIIKPRVIEILGPDRESLQIGFRFNGDRSDENMKATLIDMLLANSTAGLIDINLLQQQKVLNAGSFISSMSDYSVHVLNGSAKTGQTLEEVKELLLEQVEKIKKGEFEDWLLKAVINDLKKRVMQQDDSENANYYRASKMMEAFVTNTPWEKEVSYFDRLSKITKEELILFANENYVENYAVVFKRTGEDSKVIKVIKPAITKVPLNKEVKSSFHKTLEKIETEKLTPEFINFDKEISKYNIGNIDVITKKNTANDLFELSYVFEFGNNADPKIGLAISGYLDYTGTSLYSPEQLRQEFYKLGSNYKIRMSAQGDRMYISLSGLSENMESTMQLFESMLKEPKGNKKALTQFINRIKKSQEDNKKSKGRILQLGLYNYSIYGAKNPFNTISSNKELDQITVKDLTKIISQINNYPHRITYYGNKTQKELTHLIQAHHKVPETFQDIPKLTLHEEIDYKDTNVFWSNFDMVQTEIILISKLKNLDNSKTAAIRLFNEYFGSGMNSIVFQEIREAQGLAYSVFSTYRQARKMNESDYFFSYIGIQADKQKEALASMFDLINNLPLSKQGFAIAKQSILNKIESERITKSAILSSYFEAEDRGIAFDIRSSVYEEVKKMSFDDLLNFHKEFITNNNHNILVVGNKDKIDFENLKQYGKVQEVSLEEIFGY